MDVQTAFFNNDLKGYNVIVEIEGTDLAREICYAWRPSGQLAGSNRRNRQSLAGCAVMMEAVRILMESGLRPEMEPYALPYGVAEERRWGLALRMSHTVLLTPQLCSPSRSMDLYRPILTSTTEREKIKGRLPAGNQLAAPLFTQWLAPFNELGAKTLHPFKYGGH